MPISLEALNILEINVSQQLKAGVGSTREYEVNDVADITGEGCESSVTGKVTLTRTDRGILVKGTLKTEIELECSRCLTPFICPLTLDIEEEYFPTIDITSGLPVTQPDEPGAFTIDEHHTLDLAEAARQYSVMGVPMKPLCKEECLGLCPECGQNLNTGDCHCRKKVTDPRWEKLFAIKGESGLHEKGDK